MSSQPKNVNSWSLVKGPPKTSAETKEAPNKGSSSLESKRLAARMVRRNAPKRRRRAPKVPALPPSIDRVSVCSVVRRMAFTNNAASQLVTRTTLASIIGGVVTVANTNVALIASSYRLNKIIVWPAAGSTVTIDVLIGGTAEQALQKESIKGADMPTGITLDKPVVFRPSPNSYLGMWQATGSNGGDGLMNVSGAAGAIMDVHLTFTLFSGVGSVCPTTPTTSTVPLGDLVYMPLDTGNKITVVALNGANH